MLRIRVDLSMWDSANTEPFWRLEKAGVVQNDMLSYGQYVLHENGYQTGNKFLLYLNGTMLRNQESPLILRDGDLLKIVPTLPSVKFLPRQQSTALKRAIKTHVNLLEEDSFGAEEDDREEEQLAIEGPQEIFRSNLVTNVEITDDGKASTQGETSSLSTTVPRKKRKRGPRKRAKCRTKLIKFSEYTKDLIGTVVEDNVDDLAEECGENYADARDRNTVDTLGTSSSQDSSGVKFMSKLNTTSTSSVSRSKDISCTEDASESTPKQSVTVTKDEAYKTALDMTPGISHMSVQIMKSSPVTRKRKTRPFATGSLLQLLKNEYVSGGVQSAIQRGNMTVGAAPFSTSVPNQSRSEILSTTSINGTCGQPLTSNMQKRTEVQCSDKKQSTIPALSNPKTTATVPDTIYAGDRICCGTVLFCEETMDAQFFPSLDMEVVEVDANRKSVVLKHQGGKVPEEYVGEQMTVQWSLLHTPMKIQV